MSQECINHAAKAGGHPAKMAQFAASANEKYDYPKQDESFDRVVDDLLAEWMQKTILENSENLELLYKNETAKREEGGYYTITCYIDRSSSRRSFGGGTVHPHYYDITVHGWNKNDGYYSEKLGPDDIKQYAKLPVSVDRWNDQYNMWEKAPRKI